MDLALLPFAGASSYPSCFDWPKETIARAAQAKKDEALERFRDGLRGLQPTVAVPFASDWALLEPDLIELNWTDRYTPAEAIAQMTGEFPQVTFLATSPGDKWTPEEGLTPGKTHGAWPCTVADVTRYAATKPALVARVDTPPGEAELAVIDAQLGALAADVKLETSATLCIALPKDVAWCFTCTPDGTVLERRSSVPANAEEVIHVQPGDVTRLAHGEHRWEELWYGYAVRVTKREGTPYYREFWNRLLGLGETTGAGELGE